MLNVKQFKTKNEPFRSQCNHHETNDKWMPCMRNCVNADNQLGDLTKDCDQLAVTNYGFRQNMLTFITNHKDLNYECITKVISSYFW